ncbi:MAG: DNA repair exonuclease [Acidobacteriota bacterium]|nr:MAG: DNA repair exonuclease [Acidobacteriota bacterium]
MSRLIRLLFFADTHLGFDLPQRPRVEKVRRGEDFVSNYARVLEFALQERVDAVVHGGDLFFRSRIPLGLATRVFEPLMALADSGMPIFIVPGNHERSAIPFRLLLSHPGIRVFGQPKTFRLDVAGVTLALAGFPFVRGNIRDTFSDWVDRTGWRDLGADGALLCIHQAVEGATVGPAEFCFRHAQDVVAGRSLPEGLLAVLSGHIHRAQVLTHDLRHQGLRAPVIYPGSIERTSFAERSEPKGFFLIEICRRTGGKLGLHELRFIELPSRPMSVVEIDPGKEHLTAAALKKALRDLPPGSAVQVRFRGRGDEFSGISRKIRQFVPPGTSVSVSFPDRRSSRGD